MAVSMPRTTPRRLAVLAAAAVIATGLVSTPAAAETADRPNISGDQTVPAYSYANAIRESVWVQSPVSSDGSGQPDRIAVDIVRPAEADAAHVQVPVVMEASPYYACCGRGNESQLKAYDADGTISSVP